MSATTFGPLDAVMRHRGDEIEFRAGEFGVLHIGGERAAAREPFHGSAAPIERRPQPTTSRGQGGARRSPAGSSAQSGIGSSPPGSAAKGCLTTMRFSTIGRPTASRQPERLAAHAGFAGRQHPGRRRSSVQDRMRVSRRRFCMRRAGLECLDPTLKRQDVRSSRPSGRSTESGSECARARSAPAPAR